MFKDKKIIYWVPVMLFVIVIYRCVNNFELIVQDFVYFISLISPFIWAFGIAYLLNPAMNYIEGKFKTRRIGSIIIIYLFVMGVITLFITIVSPRIISSIGEILQQIPDYLKITNTWIDKNIMDSKLIERYGIQDYVDTNLNQIVSQTGELLNVILNKIVKGAIGFTSTFLKIVLGVVISIYLLNDKEGFILGIKKLVYSILDKKNGDSLLELGREIDEVFSKYIIGKLIDSLIIGILCLVGLIILKIPYALLIALIVGATNMIPYFGPFIGMVPSVIIVLFNDPVMALKLFVFILALQQFDGWVLGPKILGDQVGLSPFWIILAIIIGGGTMGILGMFLGVPVFAVIKKLTERYVDKKLKLKHIEIG